MYRNYSECYRWQCRRVFSSLNIYKDHKMSAIEPTDPVNQTYSHNTSTPGTSELDEESGDMLHIAGTGIQGALERLPLNAKLLAMIATFLLGLVGTGIFLLVMQAKSIKSSRTSKLYLDVSFSLDTFIGSLQEEREAANIFFAIQKKGLIPPEDVYQKLIDRIEISTINQKIFNNHFGRNGLRSHPTLASGVKAYDEAMEYLDILRNDTLYLRTDALFGFYNYNGVVDKVFVLLDSLTLLKEANPVMFSYILLERAIELELQLKSVGVISWTSNTTTFNTVRGYAKFSGQRDYTIAHWRSSSKQELVKYYDNVVDPNVVSQLKAIFEKLVGINNPSTKVVATTRLDPTTNITKTTYDLRIPVPEDYTLEQWNNLTLAKISSLSTVNLRVKREIIETTARNLRISTGLIVGVFLVIISSLLLSGIVAFVVVRTIVGPWKKMNFIQKQSIQKFVPQRMLKLFGIDKIEDAILGLHKQQSMVMVSIKIHSNHQTTTKPFTEWFVSHLQSIGPMIQARQGFIKSYNNSEIVALFLKSRSAVDTVLSVESYLRERKIRFAIGIHRSQFVISTVGHDNHLQCIVSGDEANIASRLQETGSYLECPILASKSMSKYQHPNKRWLRIGAGSHEIFQLITKDHLIVEKQQLLDNAVSNFEIGNYKEAVVYFGQLHEYFPEERFITRYLEKSKDLEYRRSIYKMSANIHDIVKEKSLGVGFEEFIKNKPMRDVYNLWKAIEEYRQSPTSDLAQTIYNTYLTGDELQIHKDVSNNIEANINLGNKELFDDLSEFIVWNINDSVNSWKQTTEFNTYFQTCRILGEKRNLEDL